MILKLVADIRISRDGEVGEPGVRDPEFPCEYFQVEEGARQFSGECWSDGHYLCDECIHYTKPEDRVIAEQGYLG